MIRWLLLLPLVACDSETAFLGSRLPSLCVDAYEVCGVTAGCALDGDHYVESSFPGALRVVLHTETQRTDLQIRIRFSDLAVSGTELLVQLRGPDCTTDPETGRRHLVDVDAFSLAGDDRVLVIEDLVATSPGEHVLEVFSDARATYQLVAEPLASTSEESP